MGTWTLRGKLDGSRNGAVLVDSVSERAYPFVFADGEEADAFLKWRGNMSGELADVEEDLQRWRSLPVCESMNACLGPYDRAKDGYRDCPTCLEWAEQKRKRRQHERDAEAARGDYLNDEAKDRILAEDRR